MIDLPKISQRSIIAFCDASSIGNNSANGIWFPATVRNPLFVSSLTAATLKIDGQDEKIISQVNTSNSNATSGIKATVAGNGVTIYAYLQFGGYATDSYGYFDRASFILSVTTAGDPQRGIEGTTRSFVINVLLLGYDWPHPSTNMLLFRVGEKVDYTFNLVKTAAEWNDIHVHTGFGDGSGFGEAVVSSVKVNGSFAPSGLTLYRGDWDSFHTNRPITLVGTATRPGIYRIELDMFSSVASSHTGETIYHPFNGEGGASVVCICIYEPYQPGNLVVLLPSSAALPQVDELRVTHVPDLGPTGWHEFLKGAQFARYQTDDYDHWSAVVPQMNDSDVVQYWYYRVQKSGQSWNMTGYRIERRPNVDPPTGYVDADTFAAMTAAEIEARARESATLATAAVRGFDDEQPPKQAWTNVAKPSGGNDFAFVGDLSLYVVPEKDATNGGWYNYAGQIEYTPDATEDDPEPDPVVVTVYERSIHYVAPADGWNYGESLHFAGARYMVDVAGWHVTENVADLAELPDVSGWTVVDVQSAHQGVAVPYCPGKEGDFGMLIPTDNGDVFHSLANQFPGEMLRVLLDNLAGAQWEFYPMRRLLSLFATGASVTISASYSKEDTSESHGGGTDGDGWGWYNDKYHEGVPSVEDLKNAEDRRIQVGEWKTESTTTTGTRVSYNVSRTIQLPYAVWDSRCLLSELCNISQGTSGLSGTIKVYRHSESKSSDKYKLYKLRRPLNDPAFAPWDPNYSWDLTSGSGEMTSVLTERFSVERPSGSGIWVPAVRVTTVHETYTFDTSIHEWTGTGTKTVQETYQDTVSTHHVPDDYPNAYIYPDSHVEDGVRYPNGRVDLGAPGLVDRGGFRYAMSIDDTGSFSRSGSGTNHSDSSGPDPYGYEWEEDVSSNVSATFTQSANAPWNYDDPGPMYDDLVNLEAYSAEELWREHENTEDGPAFEGSSIANKSVTIKARAFFGDGRDSDDPHRVIALAGAGGLGWAGGLSVPGSSGTYEITGGRTYRYKRTRGVEPDAEWQYEYDAPDGTEMTDEKWGSLFPFDDDEGTDSLPGASASINGSWDFASGLIKALFSALLSGVSFSGNYTYNYKEASCYGSYYDVDEGETVSWEKAGTKTHSSSNFAGLPSSSETDSSGDDPDSIAPNESTPRDHNVQGAEWSTSRSHTTRNCSFTVNIRDNTGAL